MAHNTRIHFKPKFDSIEKVIPFNPAWKNSTGKYFDNAVRGEHMVVLQPGEEAKSTDDLGRKMIFIGTSLGPIVVFQRYQDEERDVYVFNADDRIRETELIPGTVLTEVSLDMIFTGYSYSAGANLNSYFERLKHMLGNPK